jgi:ketosteroid isomerase-like protein
MKKKNVINIRLFGFIAILFLINSCYNNVKTTDTGSLLKADREFSAMSVKEGMHKAFLSFFADSGVMLRNDNYPLMGKPALAEIFTKRSDSTFVLSWEPVFEKIAASGEIGYTYGIFTNTVKATGAVERGTYVTIWEKQKDGSWKFVLDTGTQGLPDKSR